MHAHTRTDVGILDASEEGGRMEMLTEQTLEKLVRSCVIRELVKYDMDSAVLSSLSSNEQMIK